MKLVDKFVLQVIIRLMDYYDVSFMISLGGFYLYIDILRKKIFMYLFDSNQYALLLGNIWKSISRLSASYLFISLSSILEATVTTKVIVGFNASFDSKIFRTLASKNIRYKNTDH